MTNSKKVEKTPINSNTNDFDVVYFNLSEAEIPKIKENFNKDIVYFDTDNLFPTRLLNAYNTSTTHNAIIQQKARLISGDSITYNDFDFKDANGKVTDQTSIDRLERFKNQPSDEYTDTLEQMMLKVGIDYEIFGAFALEVIWYNDGTIKNVSHINVSTLRFKPEDNGIPKSVWYSSNWENQKKYNFQAISVPLFNPAKARTDKKQIFYYGNYNPQIPYYGMPKYYTEGGLDYMKLEGLIASLQKTSAEKGWLPTLHITFFGEVPSKDERLKRAQKMNAKFQGGKNPTIIDYALTQDTATKIEAINQNNQMYKMYNELANTICDKILTAHNLTSPLILGIKTPGQLGNGNEMELAWETFFNSVIKPERKILKDALNTFAKYIVPKAAFTIENEPLIGESFSEKILASVLTVNEIRSQLNMSPIETPDGEQSPDKTIGKAIA